MIPALREFGSVRPQYSHYRGHHAGSGSFSDRCWASGGAVAENEVQREGGEGRAIRVPAIEVLRSRAGVDYPS